MVKVSGAPVGAHAVRALNQPVPTPVDVGPTGFPRALYEKRRRNKVRVVRDYWRIEDEWWRGQSIKRTYFQVLLDDGREATIFLDHATRAWFMQRYG